MADTDNNSVPKIADVAEVAGVSTATVSRCLNTPDLVQEATRLRVQDAIERLGYTPNLGARALVAKRTNTIGAIIPTMENAIFARGLQAFQETLTERGVTLLVASSQYQPELEEDQIRTLIARGVDGFLLIGYQRRDEIYQELKRRGLSAVVAWAHDPASAMPAVGFDNRQAMERLAGEVIRRGHRDLAVISAKTRSNDRARERVEGVRQAMRKNGMAVDELRLVETTYAIDAGGYAFSELMQGARRPTAVMCGNDVLAAGAMREAKRMNLHVPENVSITGFDDIELATLVEPALTTVHVPHREMGRRAALSLMKMIRSGEPAKSIELETSIQMRASLGYVRTAHI